MWNLTSYDINRIKGQLQARKARIDAKYAEETKGLDADFADLETLERVAAVLALKYKADEAAAAKLRRRSPVPPAEENPPTEAEAGAGSAACSSPWRGQRSGRKVWFAVAPGSARPPRHSRGRVTEQQRNFYCCLPSMPDKRRRECDAGGSLTRDPVRN